MAYSVEPTGKTADFKLYGEQPTSVRKLGPSALTRIVSSSSVGAGDVSDVEEDTDLGSETVTVAAAAAKPKIIKKIVKKPQKEDTATAVTAVPTLKMKKLPTSVSPDKEEPEVKVVPKKLIPLKMAKAAAAAAKSPPKVVEVEVTSTEVKAGPKKLMPLKMVKVTVEPEAESPPKTSPPKPAVKVIKMEKITTQKPIVKSISASKMKSAPKAASPPPKAASPPPKAASPPPKAASPPPKAASPPPKAASPPPKAEKPIIVKPISISKMTGKSIAANKMISAGKMASKMTVQPKVSPPAASSPKSPTLKVSPKSPPTAKASSPKSPAKVSPKSPAKVSPKSPAKVSPKSPAKVSPKSPAKVSPKSPAKVSPKSPAKVSPKSPAKASSPKSPAKVNILDKILSKYPDSFTKSPLGETGIIIDGKKTYFSDSKLLEELKAANLISNDKQELEEFIAAPSSTTSTSKTLTASLKKSPPTSPSKNTRYQKLRAELINRYEYNNLEYDVDDIDKIIEGFKGFVQHSNIDQVTDDLFDWYLDYIEAQSLNYDDLSSQKIIRAIAMENPTHKG